MKKRIWIFRHGEAERQTANDPDRVLTERGEHDARAAGQWLAGVATSQLQIFASPYQRALPAPAAKASSDRSSASFATATVPPS